MNKIAVIGSGVMGAGIAALIASAGYKVYLFDIVDNSSADRSKIAKDGIARMLVSDGFTHPKYLDNITACNLEDNLPALKEVDWIVEVIIEKLDIKHKLYERILPYCKLDVILSSNTSTIPLAHLVSKLDQAHAKRFFITHFFNPPRYLPLVELVAASSSDSQAFEKLHKFIEHGLGKSTVMCKDTPGFIANRIGCYWIAAGIKAGLKYNVDIAVFDKLLVKFGIPKTGLFGLADLIGLDVLKLIASSFLDNFKLDDDFRRVNDDGGLLERMIEGGYKGRKGKGGFYRMLKHEDGSKSNEVLDLAKGEYKGEEQGSLPTANDLTELLSLPNYNCQALKELWLDTLYYTASLVPEIADGAANIDAAMKLGFNWKYGPFEIIDKLGIDWLNKQFKSVGKVMPELPNMSKASMIKVANKNVVLENSAARLLDIGDGVVSFEILTSNSVLDHKVFEAIESSVDLVSSNHLAMIIAGGQNNFCLGANLKLLLEKIDNKAWDDISSFIKHGQQAMSALKFSPFPVVSAPFGMALGGGCELLLHSDAVVAHIETQAGLVETKVGLIPGWGGCKEMIIRSYVAQGMDGLIKAFTNIVTAKTTKSADYLQENLYLDSKRVMNKNDLLVRAKDHALSIVESYKTPYQKEIIPVITDDFSLKLNQVVEQTKQSYIALELYNLFVASCNTALDDESLFQYELDAFLRLVHSPDTYKLINKTIYK
jgi:3-hydroxyacyl-CoA dehydrogenase